MYVSNHIEYYKKNMDLSRTHKTRLHFSPFYL